MGGWLHASAKYVFRKPTLLLFELAARKAQLPVSDIRFCGDNLACGVQGAKNAGILSTLRSLAKARRSPADLLVVRDWLESAELLNPQVSG